MKSIARRDTGESYGEMLLLLAEERGIKTPAETELIALDRKVQGTFAAGMAIQRRGRRYTGIAPG